MRRELRDTINCHARRFMREGICETWDEAKMHADAFTRCNAKTRKGTPCQARGLGKGGRCRFHGGMSTGPKTPEGKARSIAAERAGYQRWRSGRMASAPPAVDTDAGRTLPPETTVRKQCGRHAKA